MSWTLLRPAIKTKLESVTDLQFVDDKYHHNVSGFPAALFEPSADPSSYETNRENEHVYTFDIYVLQEMEKLGRDEAIRILGETVDAIVAAFDADFTLGGLCHMLEAVTGEWGEATVGEGAIRFSRLTIKAHVLKDI